MLSFSLVFQVQCDLPMEFIEVNFFFSRASTSSVFSFFTSFCSSLFFVSFSLPVNKWLQTFLCFFFFFFFF
ncbi:hypothetical protein DM02DRAFT_2712 [Periconia macrospinosa]|uniref:Uncharacterized protein n=1 Tax=Periconia macrospinosa TaxID=97972 RepID=A0A2V1EFC7_9PLEO|nr:hypothetical protein DM02DRAFT_2712 [Periconia macrospinosa]